MKMEEINRNNYEEWFIDHLDGRLSAEQEEVLRAFLVQNPDLKAELDGISGFSLEPGADALDEDLKDLLFKSGNDIPGISSVDQLCIARMEGDLTPSGSREFDNRITADPELGIRYGAFLQTRLKAGSPVVFPDKEKLMRKSRVLTPWIITAVSSAAILVIALLLWPRYQQPAEDRLAGVNAPGVPAVKPDQEPVGQPATPSATEPEKVSPSKDLRLASAARTRTTPTAKTVKEAGSGIPEKAGTERAFVPMTSLARTIRLTGVKIPEPQNDRLLFASAYPSASSSFPDETLTVPQYALRLFRERVLGEERAVVKKTRFSMWEVAGAGVNKINDIAGTKMKLSREYDDKGDLLAISFNSKLVDVERPVRSQSAR